MRAVQATGIRTGFPHSADLYELITSKTWLATLSLLPNACLPAAVLVNKGSLGSGPVEAARRALASLQFLRAHNAFQQDSDHPAPSVVNQNGIQKGVVKLGWSWEARFVKVFTSLDELAAAIRELLTTPGCLASSCIVQEWVDFDFEMRFYFFPPAKRSSDSPLLPTRCEFNAWNCSDNGQPGQFIRLSREACIHRWAGDASALQHAYDRAVTLSQFLLQWLLCLDADPVPMIRLDFMLRRIGPGKARVIFGEFCEMGACCLGWEEGPPTVWRAALDAALR